MQHRPLGLRLSRGRTVHAAAEHLRVRLMQAERQLNADASGHADCAPTLRRWLASTGICGRFDTAMGRSFARLVSLGAGGHARRLGGRFVD
jgi:hypothetical protein